MYSKNGDKRVPPGIILPENYSGNAFIKQDGTPSEQPRGNGGSGAQSAEDRGCATSGCGDRQMCETDTARKAGPERADDGDAGCGCRERPCGDAHGMPAVPECGCSDRAPEAKPGCGAPGFMNISIGTEELLLLGVMALVFFSGEHRDNELLICLLLILLI